MSAQGKQSLTQFVAAVTSIATITVAVVLVIVAAVSSRHLITELQDDFGHGIAAHLAGGASVHLANNDLLGLEALLLSWHDQLPLESIKVYNLDGKEMAVAGEPTSRALREYRANILINESAAGLVRVTLGRDRQLALQQTLMLGLLGLAVILCLVAVVAARAASRGVSGRVYRVIDRLRIADASRDEPLDKANELGALEKIAARLPLELLAPTIPDGIDPKAYKRIAVVYLQLNSLADYVDTLDEAALQRYTRRTHQIIASAAKLYGGDLSVVRQFGIALRFAGKHPAGSPALRAASVCWLIHELARELKKRLGRNMSISIAAASSELGVASEQDIYPELYLQHCLDELQKICATLPPRPLLSPDLCRETDVETRVETLPTELDDYAVLAGFSEQQRELLERQLRLIWKQLAVATGEAPARLPKVPVNPRR